MKNLFDNAVQQSVISSSAMEKETSLLVHSAMNHIIIGNPMCCGAYAQNAISAIKISHPERFEGVKDYFTFDLRYTAPFNKFLELKRLQGTAAQAAGRRSEFCGYIIMDLSSWLNHQDEEYFNIALFYLIDRNYQNNGGDGTVSWTVHYEVSKTSTTTLSGQEGPFSSQAEANAAAEAAKNAAISQLKNEAQGMVDAAIAAARAELATIRFSYDEVEIPYGFEEFNGSLGSHQTITVPADSSNDYVMKNDEWSLQVNLKKVDSETGEQIAGDALYEVYEWDTVTQQYIPFGGYNQYTVIRNEDGTYSVANGTDYGTEYDTSRKMYYTQRNEGKFIIVETRAPSGYYGDWTDVEHPGTAGTPLGKRGYYIEITKANDDSVVTLDNTHHSADIATSYTGGTKLLTSGGVETTVTIYKASDEPAAEIQYQEAGRVYNTDNSGTAAKEDSYIMTPKEGVMQNDRSLGEISISKVDLDAVRYVGGRDTDGDAMASGQAHADARLDGAVYDLYAAEDIQHPDGVTGTVDYSKITYADGTPIWHTTIRDNSGQWVDDYLPVLAKDHLVASAVIENGCLTFSNLYLGKYYIVERGTGVVIPVEDGAYKLSGTYPDVDGKTKEPTGTTSQLATNNAGQYTDYVYKHQWSYIGQSKALDGTKTYDGYYESYATGYLCDEHNYYITPAYADEGWYIEKTAFEDNRRAEGEQLDTTTYSANYHLHRDNVLAESQDQVMKGNVELSKHVSSTGSSDGIDLEGAGFTFYLISDLSKEDQFAQTRSGKYLIKSILDVYINPEYDESHPSMISAVRPRPLPKPMKSMPEKLPHTTRRLQLMAISKTVRGMAGWPRVVQKNISWRRFSPMTPAPSVFRACPTDSIWWWRPQPLKMYSRRSRLSLISIQPIPQIPSPPWLIPRMPCRPRPTATRSIRCWTRKSKCTCG